MRPLVTAYVALGANLGDAYATLVRAMGALAKAPAMAITRRSSLYRTAPVDSSGPDYLNAVIEIQTRLPAPVLLACLQDQEQRAGRLRPYRNAPRTLDLDLLLYGTACIQSTHLVVPHPRMFERAFVLVPLAEIAPHRVTALQLDAVQGQEIRLSTKFDH